ncbi:MAG: outer membrane protein assembly factor BamE [Methylococcaceae bacterium]
MNNLPGVYSLEIQQGNIINQEMIDQLRPKMTKRQVLYIMGSSMLVDVFHQKRWDYLYSEQPGGETRKQKRLSLFFLGDELIGVQGDFRPSTLPVITESNESTIEVPKRDLEKTLWEMITGLFSGDDTPTEPDQVNDEKTIETPTSTESAVTPTTSLEQENPQPLEETQN